MRVIKKSYLQEFSNMHENAGGPLRRWYEITSKAEWDDLEHVRSYFPHADQVRVVSGRPVVVFNIGGNNFRLITAIHFNTQTVYVLRIMTHAEYDKADWKKRL